MPDVLFRLLTASWNGLPIASLAIFTVGGLLYVAMARATSAPVKTRALTNNRPGWIARRRARGGIVHSRGVCVGYASATRSVYLTPRELAGHGLVVGGPGSGKTTFLQLVVAMTNELQLGL